MTTMTTMMEMTAEMMATTTIDDRIHLAPVALPRRIALHDSRFQSRAVQARSSDVHVTLPSGFI